MISNIVKANRAWPLPGLTLPALFTGDGVTKAIHDSFYVIEYHLTPIYKGLMVMMLMMSMIVTIRTGQYVHLSTPRFTRVSATGLAQNHPPPEVTR